MGQAIIALALVLFSITFFEKRKAKYRDEADEQSQNGQDKAKKAEK